LDPSDQDLFLLAKTGDSGAFGKIVELNQGYAYALAIRFLGNEQDAEDVVQEAFIRVWRNLRTYDPARKFTTWFYRIVANLCLDRIKAVASRKRSTGTESGLDPFEDPPSDEDVEKTVHDRDTVRLVLRLVQELPPKQRMVFVLRDLQDLRIEEVSNVLGMPHHSVKSNLCLARAFLRNRIHGLEGGG
jgi:RNA polymerase sigma-70 factor (ECF subfamily)